MKTLWKALCAAAMVGMTMLSAQAEEKTITVGTMSWEDLTPITGITKKVLEDSGYTERIRGVDHAIWCDRPSSSNADGRGAVFYGDKAIDRSPGGTGTSARLAQLYGKGRLKVGDTFRQESLIGTVFEGRVEAEADIGPFKGIKPSVSGWARIIGHNTIFVDDRDPLAHGFQIR